MENNWHDIPGYEWLYQFNWHTNEVKSIERTAYMYRWPRKVRSRILKTNIHNGSVFVILNKDGNSKIYCLWRLTLLITTWPKPEWMVCCHNDWNQYNNFPDNVRYDTQSENIKDAVRHWTHDSHKRWVKRIGHDETKSYKSIRDALRDLWKDVRNCTNIRYACIWKYKQVYGYQWEYIS